MCQWTDILTAEQLTARHNDTARLDASFARGQRQWYEGQTRNELKGAVHAAWLCNDADGYQLARSYLAIKEA